MTQSIIDPAIRDELLNKAEQLETRARERRAKEGEEGVGLTDGWATVADRYEPRARELESEHLGRPQIQFPVTRGEDDGRR
jgi:hypothetical protein